MLKVLKLCQCICFFFCRKILWLRITCVEPNYKKILLDVSLNDLETKSKKIALNRFVNLPK